MNRDRNDKINRSDFELVIIKNLVVNNYYP